MKVTFKKRTEFIRNPKFKYGGFDWAICSINSWTQLLFNAFTELAFNFIGLEFFAVIVHPMAQYTKNEYANMHYIYGECRGNAAAAAALYRERYPNARHPDHRVFVRLHNSLCEGRFPGTGPGGALEGRPHAIEREEEVLEEFEADSSLSVREVARHIGISKSTVHNIAKLYQLHPYHVQRVQTLQPRDYAAREFFCRTMLRMMREDHNFYNSILWSDESSCTKDGFMNQHNLHSWQIENPHAAREGKSQYRFKINLWTGILDGQIIGPYELPGTLNSEMYLNFLQNELPILLENIQIPIRRIMWLQNDGCSAHYAMRVRNFLNEAYPRRWIGRLGPILWPPRSPDLNPLDFFYWGCLKQMVYRRPVGDIQELRERINTAAQEISHSGCARQIKASFKKRCRKCIAVGGGHFEHLL